MILPVQERIRAHVTSVLAGLYSLDPAGAALVALEYPPNRELGDLGTPIAFATCGRHRVPSHKKSRRRLAHWTV